MIDFKQYDNAVAKYHTDINIKTTPISSWNFHHSLVQELKNAFVDANTIAQLAISFKWQKDILDLKSTNSDEVIIVTDANLSIVFASQNITKMNGYKPEEVIGQRPTMFQGKSTSAVVSRQIGQAIQMRQPFEKTVVNYKKNGDTYICMIKGYPIFNDKGELCHFIAFEIAA